MASDGQVSEDRIRVDPDGLRTFAADVLAKLGVPSEDAAMAADVLVYADLRGVRIVNCNLDGADLREADLRGAWVSDVTAGGTDLDGADLRGCGGGGLNPT